MPVPEEAKETDAKRPIHEAVGDRVAARRGVRQQLEEADAAVAQAVIHGFGMEQGHRVEHVQGRPAYEEFYHHNEEHSDDALFGGQGPVLVSLMPPNGTGSFSAPGQGRRVRTLRVSCSECRSCSNGNKN